MKCIIPCAGKGTRMRLGIPKTLIEVGGRSLLGHITYQWSDSVDGFVIIVSPENEELIKQGSGEAEFVVQEEPRGLANAILLAEPYVTSKFVINLGDCLFRGRFEEEKEFELGIGVWETYDLAEINKSYLVGVSPSTGLVEDVIEKPNLRVPHGNCGMGIYFMDNRIFDYIRKTRVTPGGGDFTEVLQAMIDNGEKIHPVYFHGNYINVSYPEDLKKAEEVLR